MLTALKESKFYFYSLVHSFEIAVILLWQSSPVYKGSLTKVHYTKLGNLGYLHLNVLQLPKDQKILYLIL